MIIARLWVRFGDQRSHSPPKGPRSGSQSRNDHSRGQDVSVCPDCGNTGLRPIEQGPAGATYTVLGRCKCQTPTVTIPCARHDALMAAVKVLESIACYAENASRAYLERTCKEGREALAALRAAGIQTETE
jgi:hypothetical protein